MKLYGKVAKGEPYRKKGTRLMTEPDESQILEKIGRPEQMKHVLKGYHMFDKAHVVMLAEEKIIRRGSAAKILNSLRRMEENGYEKARMKTNAGLHSGEAYLIEKLGEEIGGQIHTGRSSGDLNGVASRIAIREKLLLLMDGIIGLRKAIMELTSKHIHTLMPSYTMHQHAQPETFAHYLLSWVKPLERDFKRMEELYKRINRSPAGAAIMTGSDFPLNRNRTAELLGFDDVITNTRDAIHGFDYVLETYNVLSLHMFNICKKIDDLYLWYTYEFRMIDLADKYCGTSSIMPQKKNPHTLQYITGVASRLFGHSTGAFLEVRTIEGSMDYRQELWQSFDEVIFAVKTMTGVISTLKVNTDRMRKLSGAFWDTATDLADTLVKENEISFRTAHQITAIVVRNAIREGKAPQDMNSKMIDEAAIEYLGKPLGLSEESVRNAMDPWKSVETRTVRGGPAPKEVKEQMKESDERIKQDTGIVLELTTRLHRASEMLENAVDAIIVR